MNRFLVSKLAVVITAVPLLVIPLCAQQWPASCIAIVMPTVEGMPGNAADAATAVRDLMASYLRGPSTKVVALEAKLPSQATEEARQKGCEPMLLLSLTRKAGGGNGLLGALGRGASVGSSSLPWGGTAGSAAARAGAAAGLEAVGSLAQSTKAKDELRLEYRCNRPMG